MAKYAGWVFFFALVLLPATESMCSGQRFRQGAFRQRRVVSAGNFHGHAGDENGAGHRVEDADR